MVAAFPQARGTGWATAVVGPDGGVLRGWAGRRAEADPAAVAMEAVLGALWRVKPFGRRLRVCVHPVEVAAWLRRQAPVPDAYLGRFVQIRALTHVYRQVEFLPASPAEVELARAVASGGLPERGAEAVADLDLVPR